MADPLRIFLLCVPSVLFVSAISGELLLFLITISSIPVAAVADRI